jgi:hypothetical protein
VVVHLTGQTASLPSGVLALLPKFRPKGLTRAGLRSCGRRLRGYRPDRAMEPGLVTLAKIVGTMLLCMGTVPLIFLLAPGDRSEPSDDEHADDHAGH